MRKSGEFLGKFIGEYGRIHSMRMTRTQIKRARSKKMGKTCIIAVMGTEHGVGTTHMCMMLGNFLSNIRGHNTALLELNTKPVIHKMAVREGFDNQSESIFIYNNIAMLENDTSIENIGMMNYAYVIMDISYDYPKGVGEFMRSDIRFLVGALNPWKITGFENSIRRFTENGLKDFACLSLAGGGLQLKQICHKYGIKVELIPYEPDVFRMKTDNMQWLHRMMLERNGGGSSFI